MLRNIIFLLFIVLLGCQYYSGSDKKQKVIENHINEEIPKKKKEIKSLLDFAKKVPLDEFNTQKESTPKEGGEIKVRIPVNPRKLNPFDNDSGARDIMNLITDSFITRDPETFEWLPWMAFCWETRDIATFNGKEIEGYYDEITQKFYPGQGMVTALIQDIKKVGNNKYQIKNNTYYGKLRKNIYTANIIPTTKQSITTKSLKRQVINLFHLRKNIKWHDGYAFKVDDIIFSYYDIIQNPYTDLAHIRNYYKDVKKIEKIDDYSFRIEFKTPYFLSFSSSATIPVIPKHRYNPERFKGDKRAIAQFFEKFKDNRHPIGTGGYIFKKWKKGTSITIVKNKKYWAKKENFPYFTPQQPYLDKIRFIIISNSNSALKELTSGNIDADFEVTPTIWADERTKKKSFLTKVVKAKFLRPIYTYIGWNNERVYFKDPKVRKALTYLIPRNKIAKEIHHSLAQIVTGPFFLEGPVYDKNLTPKYYNPIKAKQLLKEAGWVDHDGDGIRDKDGIAFEFEYLIHNARKYHQKIADIVKESLEQAGIIVNIRIIDWTVFSKTVVERNFDAVRFAWGTSIDGDPYQIWHSSQAGSGGSNHISYHNKEVDEILTSARTIFNPLTRWKKYRKMHEILYEEQPYTFLFSFFSLGFYNKKFRGVKLYSSGHNLNEWYLDH